MLTEEQLEYIPEVLRPLFQYLENEVIVDVARRIKETLAYTRTAEIEAQALQRLGYSPSRIRKEAMKLLNADAEFRKQVAKNTLKHKKEVKKCLQEIAKEAYKENDKLFSEIGDLSYLDDLRTWKSQGKELNDSSFLHDLVQGIERQTKGELKNLTRTTGFKTMAGFESIQDTYRRELDKALIKVCSGAYTKEQVIYDVVHDLSRSGLRSIDYASGRHKQLDTAVTLAVRTGAHQLAEQMTAANVAQSGENLIYVSRHWGARNTGTGHANHEEWQGKVYYIKPGEDYTEEAKRIGQSSIEDLWEVTGYSMDGAHPNDPFGLNGYNCRHKTYVFFKGISKISDIQKEEDEPKPVEIDGKVYDYYAMTQKMRSMERNIRALKREREALNTLGMDTKEIKVKIKQKTAEYENFCDKYGMKAKLNRLRYDSKSADITKTQAYKEYRNSITDAIKGDIIELRRDKYVSGAFKASDEHIEDILDNELSGVKFTVKPVYNARIRSQGKTSATISPLGRITVNKIEIGKQMRDTRECLIDSLLHEELEARIMKHADKNEFYKHLNETSEKERHKYINKVIKRFFDGKGIDYELV